MKRKILKLSRKPFVRNVAAVASGTAAAQAISLVFAPIITRIYGPEAIGVLGIFMAVAGLVVPVAALTYPIAIVLPKKNAEAKSLIVLSLIVAGTISVFAIIILAFFNEQLLGLLQIEVLAPFVYLIPLIIFLAAVLQVMQQWLIRTKQFFVTAKVAVLQALILSLAKVGVGYFNPVAAVLIFLTTLGNALYAFMLFIGERRSNYVEVEESTAHTPLLKLAKRYIDFPLYRAPQVFINAASQSLPILMLASFFGPASAGFYTIGRTALGVPSQLIGKSVGDVFYPRISEAANNGENLTHLITKATLALAVLGILPFGIVVAFGPWLFALVFGEEWVVAGEYARWQSLWFYFAFLNRPTVAALPVLDLQKRFLLYELVSICARAAALVVGFYYFKSDMYAVAIFSMVGVVLNTLLILYTINKSRSYFKLENVGRGD